MTLDGPNLGRAARALGAATCAVAAALLCAAALYAGQPVAAREPGRAQASAPRLSVRTPRAGEFVASRRLPLELRYADDAALDLASLRVTLDGVDRTPWFAAGPRSARTERELEDGRHTIEATIRDAAGRTASVKVAFTVDTVAPELRVLEPAADAFVAGGSVDVSGGVVDASPVSVSVGPRVAVVKKRSFRARQVPVGTAAVQELALVARDAAGNTSTAALRLRVDRAAPVVRIESPRADAEVKGPSLRVTGAVGAPAAGKAGASGRAPGVAGGQPAVVVEVNGRPAEIEGGSFRVDVPAPAGRLELRAVLRSASGATATDTVTVHVDGEAPELTVETPQPDAATSARSLRVAGRVSDPKAAVRVNGAPALVADGAFEATAALPREGRQIVLVVAEDPAGNRSEVEVPVLVDRTAPEVSLLSLPEGAPVDGRSVTVAGSLSDLGAVSVTVNGQPAERLELGWRADLTGLAPGPQVIETVARDEAGNETTLTHAVTVAEPQGPVVVAAKGGPLQPASPAAAASPLAMTAQAMAASSASGEGVVVGQVLSDVTGLPLAGAAVTLQPGGAATTTDAQGLYSFATPAGPVTLSIGKAGMTSVARAATVAAAAGTVAIDARLTPLAAPVAIDGSGGVLNASFARRLRPSGGEAAGPATLALTLPPGAVASPQSFTLTALGAQGLPALLPLGWSPIVAFTLDGSAAPASLEARFQGLPAIELHLAAWDAGQQAWTLVAASLHAQSGVLDLPLPGRGGFALVAADPGGPAIPATGAPLTESAFVTIPEGAVGRSFADPPSLPSSGGSSRGRIEVDSPQPLPSGTVVQAVLDESFRLASGELATTEERLEDILLFRADLDGFVESEAGAAGLAAEVPIVPSRQHTPIELDEGTLSLRVLAGREGARGAGGSSATTVTSGGASLEIPAGALPADTAVSLALATSPSPFVPRPAGLTVVAEVRVDLTGASLALAAGLRVPAGSAPAGGSLFVARFEQAGGATQLQVVAWAERQGDEVVTVARPHLQGLRRGGRYVVYHAAPAVGFLSGVTRAAGAPRPALVTTSRLPFVGIAGSDGAYSVLTLAGSVRASARVLGTALSGSADAELAAGSVRALDINLAQAVTLALVTPASGATGVPVTRQVELLATAALDPATVTAAAVSLRRASDSVAIPVRTVLSADARHVAVIPQTTLAYQTGYTFESTGLLRDIHGAPVAVPVVEFTTQSRAEAQALDLSALVFSYPVDGMVTMRAAAGALPAGTQILVLNASAGSALTYSVGAGAVEAQLRASIADRLWVTVTDPQGLATTIERTEYVAPDGTTAVGVAGGTVRGPQGSEMRLPPGVTDGPVTIKISSFAEGALPEGQRPDLPGGRFGYGLAIDSADKPRFKSEVDLVFPRPADAPEGAFFYVFRQIQLPGGRFAYETIDQALAEGGKVVTASFPFGGYQTSFGVLGLGVGAMQLQAQSLNHAILMWTHDEITPGRATAGAITGQVLRAGIDPDTGSLVYEPIAGAIVTGVDATDASLLYDMDANSISSAVSQPDGTFTMIDSRYTGGLVKLAATTPQAETRVATAYQSNPLDSENRGLRFFPNVARVVFTFDPLEPAPGPAVVDLALVRLGDADKRERVEGLVVEGSRLLVGITRRNAEVELVSIGGVGHAFGTDAAPLSEPLRFDLVTSAEFVASPSGMYRVEVLARDAAGNPRTISQNFRVVPLGGGNSLPLAGQPPEVLDARSFPDRDARNVEVTALPQIEFSEPVRNVPGSVTLTEIDSGGVETPVSIRLLGIAPGLESPVDVTPVAQAGQPVVSLIVGAQPGLRYDRRYRLDVSGAILDLDPSGDGGPRPLTPYSTEFTTAKLAEARAHGSYPTAGVAFQDGFAYVAENGFTQGTLRVYDVRDPRAPEEIAAAQRLIENRPVDIAAKPRRLVVGTTVPARSVPSNLHVFDISRPDAPEWVGAASVSQGVLDGTLLRVVLRGSYAYGLVLRKGVQVVDLRVAEANVAATGGPTQAAYWTMRRALNTNGQGFGMDAVVATIPLPIGASVQWYPHDLDVADYVLDGRPQPLAVVGSDDRLSGSCSLLVGSVLGTRIESNTRLRTVGGQDLCPVRVALGRVAGRDVAVLGVAYGSTSYAAASYGVAVVDMADPKSPQLLGVTPVDLPDLSDLVLDGEAALVSSAQGGTEVVNLASPDQPYVAGRVGNLSGRLAIASDGTYLSSGGSFGDAPEGGLHVAGGPPCNLLELREERLMLEVVRDPVDATLCGGGDVLVFNVCEASRVTLRIDGRLESLSVDGMSPAPIAELDLQPGWHTVNVPFGTIGTGLDTVKPFVLSARSQADAAVTAERAGTIQNKLLNRPVLPIGRTFVKGVDLFDGHVVRQATDVRIQGRHLGLELTRTYSSSARGEDGRAGAGWGFNYDAAVSPMSCGLYNVSTADGGGQVFRTSDGGFTFTPQRGYHGALKRLVDKSYEYVDKAGVKHYFREPVDPMLPEGARRLDRSVEPHGDRIELAYDLQGRVSSVREVLRGERPVRSLDIRYTRVYGHDRLRSVESSLGHRVEYGYDAKGNLTSVKRSGQNVDGGPDAEPLVESYEYSTANFRDPHQLTAAVGLNGERTEYAYYEAGDSIPGEGIALSWIVSHKEELARRVTEFANGGPAPKPETAFSYDFSQGGSGAYTTTVRDARGNDSVYSLNIHGSPTRIQEPLGKETVIGWKPNDILKAFEQDALGRVTRYDYDARGNLTSERIEKDAVLLAETAYQYDPSYNKLTYKRDAEGRETTHTIDPTTGDLLATVDPVGNRTEFHYDADGQLDRSTDPRGFTTFFRSFNDFGSPREIVNPLGQLTTRRYDSRNRMVEESQEPYGRLAQVVYDGHDRPVERVRVSGDAASEDERTLTEYYPGGQPRATTNALGARTEYALDGLNRVVRTAVEVGGDTLTTETQYDGNGNAEWEKDRRGVARRSTFDALNRHVRVEIESAPGGVGPLGRIADYGYDLAGNKTSETDLNGFVTAFEYDDLYHLERKVLPLQKPGTPGPYDELYLHDKAGNLRRATDANGRVTETEYDGLNRPTRITRDAGGLGLVTTTTYDDPQGSHVHKSEDKDLARGFRTTYLYDELGREKERTVRLEGEDGNPAPNPGPYTATAAYVDAEHAVRVTDPRGVVTQRKLDGLDRVVAEAVDTDGLAPAAALSLVSTIAYDGLGNKTAVTDPEGRTTRFDYDGLGRLRKTTDARGGEQEATYLGDGLKASETDRRGVTRLFEYDALGRPLRTRLASAPFSGVAWSQETRYVDGPAPRRIEVDARGKETAFDLDPLGRVVKETDALGHYRTFGWDGVNKLDETDKRPPHHRTRFEYDGINRLVKTTDPLVTGETIPFTVETAYEDALNRVTTKDRRGFLTRTQSDPLGRVVTVTRAVGAPEAAVLETNAYDPNGNKVQTIDAEGRKTRFEYDAANRLSAREDGFESPEASRTIFVYDKTGNLLQERDARAAALGDPWSTKRSYDALNRLETETNGEGNVTTYGYDPEGNRSSATTPKLQTTTTLHDELGKPLSVTQPSPRVGETSPVTLFRYDENRNLVRMEDPDGRVTKLEYDDLNRLFKTTRDPGALNLVSETTEFDEDGRPLRIAEANGEVTRQTWDELGRLSTRTHEPPATGWTAPWQYTSEERYSYDPNSNLERVEEHDVRSGGGTPPVRVTTRGYDRLDRQTSETVTLQDGSTKGVTTEYWRNGQVKSVTDAQGTTSYSYDGQGREETVTTSAGETRKTYYPDDLVKDITFPNLTKRAHGYDKADRPLSIVTTKDGAPVASTAYSYDPNGNRLTQVQTNGAAEELTRYTYDDLDRLWTVTYAPDAGHPNGRKVTYGHDGAGNRKTEVVTDPTTEAVLESKAGVFDNANRLTELTDNLDAGQTTTLAWDRNGNLLSETKAGVTTSYRYDLRDTLAEVERGGQMLARFLGDFDERRVLKIGDPTRPGGSGVQEYVYNGSRLILDVENGQPTARYEWTNEELVSLLQNGGQRRYFALDGLETVLALTDEQGQATDRLNFDVWGVPKAGTDFGTSGNRFAFTSHRFDTELNLYYAGGRMYSPTIGRFISQDNLGLDPNNPDSWNLFNYAGSRPTFYVDPTGHAWIRAQDLKNAGMAFVGAVYGVGEVIAAPGVFTYQATGAFLYNVTGEWQYKSQAESFARTTEALGKTFQSPEHFVASVAEGFTSQAERFNAAIERGDPFQAGAGLGNAGGQVLVAAEGVRATAGGMPTFATAVTAEGVTVPVAAGSTAALLGPGASSAAILTSNNTTGGGEPTIVQENTPTKQNASATKQVPAKADPAKASTPKKGVQANKAAGDAWEAELINDELPQTQTDIRPQIMVKSKGPSGTRTRLDALGTDEAGAIRLTEGKASPTAPLTPNQKVAHPEIEVHGGTVVGKGKPPYVGGTEIPPTKVDVRRKS